MIIIFEYLIALSKKHHEEVILFVFGKIFFAKMVHLSHLTNLKFSPQDL